LLPWNPRALITQNSIAIISQNRGTEENHATNSLKGFGVSLDFPVPSLTTFRVEKIFADDDFSPR